MKLAAPLRDAAQCRYAVTVVQIDVFKYTSCIQQRAAVAVCHAFGVVPFFVCQLAQS
jgi:hypothetical protein